MENNLKKYLITDPKYYSNKPILFEKNLRKALETKNINMACFRDKQSKNFVQLAQIFIQVCKEYKLEQILINGNYKLAKRLQATGVHLTSTQFDEIEKAKELGLYTIISCHNFFDIEDAKNKNVDAITYSPIFNTPNKGKAKGIEDLKQCIKRFSDINIIALGGIIEQKQIDQITQAKAYGFASIRYFI